MKKPAILATTLFLVIAFGFLAYQRMHKPRVFILHSYAKSMPWVQSLNQGIKQIFEDTQYVSLRYFYMDTKRKTSKRYLERISQTAIRAISAWNPDIVIAFDDNAQKMVGEKLTHKKNCKVIFAGITDSQHLYQYETDANVTGVLEQIPLRAIKEVLSLVFHHKKRIYYLSDDSNTAKALDKNIIGNNWGSYKLVAHKRVKTFKQWQKAVLEAQKKADIILVSVYHTIKEGKKQVDPKKLVSWMNKNSKIPTVGIYESFIVDGGWIAIAVSSIEQGYTAAWLALKSIEKQISFADIPFVRSKTFHLYIRKNKVKKHFSYAHIPMILDVFSKNDWSLDDIATPEITLEKRLKKLE
jgi:ABC-type uncharacterized transport system substrate-binding protein